MSEKQLHLIARNLMSIQLINRGAVGSSRTLEEQTMSRHTKERLKNDRFALERKIGFTRPEHRMVNHFNGSVYVAFSGGKDSTALL